MIPTLSLERRTRALEFGIYRDGDNNLDHIQSLVLHQAMKVSLKHPSIEFTVEDTDHLDDSLATWSYTFDDGEARGLRESAMHDMSSRTNLARFVARTLDNAEKVGAKQTWIDLVDHGAGDGGGLEADHAGGDVEVRRASGERRVGIMREDDMAGAISDGVALHVKEHPEDAGRRVDGVIANECLMATLGFSSALSHAGVRYLAASPETMLAPGVPSEVAIDIAKHDDDPPAMARGVVDRVMETRYFPYLKGGWSPAAAFDVIDLDPQKIADVEGSVRTLDAALTAAAHDRAMRAVIREDAKVIEGMVRFPKGKHLPWRADRPAIALYDTFSEDGRLPQALRSAAASAADAVRQTVLAHREVGDFVPFADADYGDAVGPTVHFPIGRAQIDPWAPNVSETDNAFYESVGGAGLATAIA
jgi:hypothetical protein